ncbi:MAG: serine protease [Pseudomonadota bacterium]
MFVAAIEKAAEFTRPIHTILRFFGSTDVHPGAATLFFINADGWALTCRHVAEQLVGADQLQQRYQAFKAERDTLAGKKRRHVEKEIERKHRFGKGTVIEVKNLFVNCVEGPLNVSLKLHPVLDIALLKFSNFTTLNCTTFPIFARTGGDLKQGQFLCRLGFPFPEFTNFSYDSTTDTINWNQVGQKQTPRFPIEGMVTRRLRDTAGTIVGFELSTPGLRGQSGGPAFDTEGRIWGMQTSTKHLDLNFDVNMEVVRDGSKKRVKNNAFLHVGHCVHIDVLKDFMREHAADFAEG